MSIVHDPFGRPTPKNPSRPFQALLLASIAGSVCPPPARSMTPPRDTAEPELDESSSVSANS